MYLIIWRKKVELLSNTETPLRNNLCVITIILTNDTEKLFWYIFVILFACFLLQSLFYKLIPLEIVHFKNIYYILFAIGLIYYYLEWNGKFVNNSLNKKRIII